MRMPARLLALLLALLLPAAALGEGATLAPQTYTVAEKFLRQLDAGTGFSGTLTLEAAAAEGREADAFTTVRPLTLGIKYIQLRANAIQSVLAEKRLDVTLMEDDAAAGALSLALRDNRAFVAGDALGEGWFQLGEGAETAATQGAEAVLQVGAAPGLYRFLLPLLLMPVSGDNTDLSEAIATYSTKIDLWLEGYRQGATLGKLEDGTSTVSVRYQVPPAAVKAQLKQMLLDVLSDPVLLLRLRSWLSGDDAARYLDPDLQEHYFAAIDALPLEGDFTLERVYSIRGGTLRLRIALPLYDAQTGAIALGYERVAPVGDTPGEQTLRFESDALTMAIVCTEYQTMTGTTVLQGTLARLPRGASAEPPALGCAFTLTYSAGTAETPDNKDCDTYAVKLSLSPDAAAVEALADDDAAGNAALADFAPFDLDATLSFTSGRAQNTSTAVLLSAVLSGDEQPQTITLTLDGKTVSPWTPVAINEINATDVGQMTAEEQGAWALRAGVQMAALLTPYFQLPQAAVPTVDEVATTVDEDTPSETPPELPTETPAP